MEAIDLDMVDRAARMNDAAERTPSIVARDGFFTRPATYVEAMPEDETYAARYHRAFQKKGNS